MTALALRDDQTQWDKQQLAVLEAGGIDGDVTDAELAAFLHECQRRKLDPFTRQIYLIGRWDKRKGRKVYRSQTSIDGFRLIARRAADKSGIDYSYEDTIWFDEKGQRHEIWLSPKPPAGAKVVVIRNGSRFDAVARFGAYVQTDQQGNPSGQWRTMADVMVAKCAEALALRKAFPEDLGGIYTEEEMAQADNPQRVQATAEVVRDEPARDAPVVETDTEWLAAALRVVPEIGLDACRNLWRETAEKFKAGQLADAGAGKVYGALEERMKSLAAASAATDSGTAETSEVHDAEIVEDHPALDSEDPWAIALAGLAGDDAEGAMILLDDLAEQMTSGDIDAGRFTAVESAVVARFPDVQRAGQAEAA